MITLLPIENVLKVRESVHVSLTNLSKGTGVQIQKIFKTEFQEIRIRNKLPDP